MMRPVTILLAVTLVGASAFEGRGAVPLVRRPLQEDMALFVCSYPGGGQGKLVKFNAQTGEKIADLPGVAEPVDADVGPDGFLFATDEAGGESNVRRFDPATGAADASPYGQTSSYLSVPRGLAFGAEDHLYVADIPFSGARIVEFDESGNFVQYLPDDLGTLIAIEDVVCDADGDIYVTQWADGWTCDTPGVYKFSEGAWVLFGQTDNLESVWGLAFGPDGDLYVAEDGSSETAGVYRYNGVTGLAKGVYGQTGDRSNLVHPRYLTFGPDGDLYVADAYDSTVRKFSGPLQAGAGAYQGIFAQTSAEDLGPFGLVFAFVGSPQEPVLSIEMLEEGDILLTLFGNEGKSYELRYTSDPTISDFTQWTFGATISLEGTTSETWTDDTASGASGRFYKAEEQ